MLLGFLDREIAAGHRLVAAIVLATEGSTYRKPGALMLLSSSGARCGLLSGGCLEGDLHEHAQRLLSGDACILERHYDGRTSDDPIWGLGLGCEGAMRILLWRIDGTTDGPATLRAFLLAEDGRRAMRLSIALPTGEATLDDADESADTVAPTMQHPGAATIRTERHACLTERVLHLRTARIPSLLLCGAGPDAEPVAQLAALVGWQVTVVDHRGAYLDATRFPQARQLLLVDAADPGARVALDGFDAAVVMSHNLVADGRYLTALADCAIPYIGLLGPAARRERLYAELGQRADLLRPRLRAPVGLDLGGTSPEAIALSIVAELQAALHRRAGAAFSAPR